MIHELENEGKRVILSRINPNEWHETLVVVEKAACQCFFIEPLQVTSCEQIALRYYSSLTE